MFPLYPADMPDLSLDVPLTDLSGWWLQCACACGRAVTMPQPAAGGAGRLRPDAVSHPALAPVPDLRRRVCVDRGDRHAHQWCAGTVWRDGWGADRAGAVVTDGLMVDARTLYRGSGQYDTA